MLRRRDIKACIVRQIVSFAAVFRDVTQRSPERKFLSGERCVTSRKTAAKETMRQRTRLSFNTIGGFNESEGAPWGFP